MLTLYQPAICFVLQLEHSLLSTFWLLVRPFALLDTLKFPMLYSSLLPRANSENKDRQL